MNDPCIILQVWHENPDGSQGICGYVGTLETHRWPLVASQEKAYPHANKILAAVAESQYRSYLRNTQPERLNTTSIRQVIRT